MSDSIKSLASGSGYWAKPLPLLAPLFLILLPAITQSAQPELEKETWRTAAPMTMKRTEVAAMTLDGKIYVVGGFEKPSLGNVLNFVITRTVDVYDPATDRWISESPLPVGLHHVGIGVVENS